MRLLMPHRNPIDTICLSFLALLLDSHTVTPAHRRPAPADKRPFGAFSSVAAGAPAGARARTQVTGGSFLQGQPRAATSLHPPTTFFLSSFLPRGNSFTALGVWESQKTILNPQK